MLRDDFISTYANRPVRWGFESGPNSLGELVYRRTYSRNGERWFETVARDVRGVYEILEEHCRRYKLPFDYDTARRDAEEMYDRIFNFKFVPPGRGLWMMGTDYIRTRGSACLMNCGFVSTKDIDREFDKPFRFLMDMSMLGVGVGFDTRGAGKVSWSPGLNEVSFQVPDSREGWVESTGALVRWGMGVGPRPRFDYSLIRPRGTPIRGFGGVCEGPDSLRDLHQSLEELIRGRGKQTISSRDIVDIMNLIGKCVVAGNVRRTAECCLGEAGDQAFLDLKNYELNPERASYGWASNNSVFATIGMNYRSLTTRITDNGEPGLIWLDTMRAYGRLADPPTYSDHRVLGVNPCFEQSLENYELCCLVETFPHHHKDFEDFKRTLKYAYLYAKSVTLLLTHWSETNAVQLRNRRIGTSISGVAQFLAYRGQQALNEWCDQGYEVLNHYDRVYSEWLCVRESIKKSSVKPSGTVSILAGATPGCHYPTHRYYIRRVRYAAEHQDIPAIRAAGYHIEPAQHNPGTVVVEFPVKGDPSVPTEREISIGAKMALAVNLQQFWADNQVSCTVTFDPDKEAALIPDLLTAYDNRLKSISFLPLKPEGAYPQMPYESISETRYHELSSRLKKIEWPDKDSHDSEDKYCDGTACEIRAVTTQKPIAAPPKIETPAMVAALV